MYTTGGIERFHLKKEIGRGAMSTVWEATDSATRSPVAVKLVHLPPDMPPAQREQILRRCRREVALASHIQHPNVVRVYQAAETKDGFSIVMEFVRGVSVRDRLRMEGKFDPGNAASIAVQLCDALAAAHRLRIVHCDVKPENILLQPAGALKENVKLVDFGVAQAARSPGEMAGAWGGSPAYMSPEQVTGGRIDGRSDIFSLGVVLFEMLTGQPAFQGDSIVAVVHQVVNVPLNLEGLPPAFRGPVARATEKRPQFRFTNVLEMKEALTEAMARPRD
jgi:serine/threonine-protein kinase